MSGTLLLAAVVLDLLLGDPRGWPHPVAALGRVIAALEEWFCRRLGRTRLAGVLLVLLTLTVAVGAAAALWAGAAALHPWLGWLVALYLGYSVLALRALHVESRRVLRALEADDLTGARQALAMIVGRDTAHLDEPEILRACVETVAENSSDGVVAPLFYLGLGGPLLAVAYKAVNTLDSMVGYRNARYREVGWAAARLDDLANAIPARLTALALVAAAPLAGLSFAGAWRILRRDRRAHPSPNAGWPEAAAAGALGVRLGGPATYQGEPSLKPTLGEPLRPLSRASYREMVRLMYLATALVLGLMLLLKGVWGG